MALVQCKECGAEVSSTAATCPKCGTTLRKPKRTLMGKLIKYTFIGFNILMLIWFISGMGGAAEVVESANSEAEQAGAAVGAGIGAMFILFIWAIGDLILGLFVLLTRPKIR